MSTRPSRGGFAAAIPTFEDPHVFLWAPTEDEAVRAWANDYFGSVPPTLDAALRLVGKIP